MECGQVNFHSIEDGFASVTLLVAMLDTMCSEELSSEKEVNILRNPDLVPRHVLIL